MSIDTIHNLLQRVVALERRVEHLYAELDVASPEPFEEAKPDLVRQLVAEGKTLQAVQAYRLETGCSLTEAQARVEALAREQ